MVTVITRSTTGFLRNSASALRGRSGAPGAAAWSLIENQSRRSPCARILSPAAINQDPTQQRVPGPPAAARRGGGADHDDREGRAQPDGAERDAEPRGARVEREPAALAE